MKFAVQGLYETSFIDCEVEHLYITGYSGRDEKSTARHIEELEKNLGIKPPAKIPTIFECSRRILTSSEEIDVFGSQNSGEAEYVMVLKSGKIYIGLGSDHTDRKLESYDICRAKEIMPKVISPVLWDYEEIKEHFDEIQLVSFQKKDGEKFIYQEGTLEEILPPKRILQELVERIGEIGDSVVFSGTIPLKDKFFYGDFFKASMVDEKLGRSISIKYKLNFITENER